MIWKLLSPRARFLLTPIIGGLFFSLGYNLTDTKLGAIHPWNTHLLTSMIWWLFSPGATISLTIMIWGLFLPGGDNPTDINDLGVVLP